MMVILQQRLLICGIFQVIHRELKLELYFQCPKKDLNLPYSQSMTCTQWNQSKVNNDILNEIVLSYNYTMRSRPYLRTQYNPFWSWESRYWWLSGTFNDTQRGETNCGKTKRIYGENHSIYEMIVFEKDFNSFYTY